MFSIKFNIFNKNNNLDKTINNFITYMKSAFFSNSKIVKNGENLEISSGKVIIPEGSNIEMVIRKVIPINEEILNDRKKLDKVLVEVRNFCDKAKDLENFEYTELIRRINYEDKP
jgi:hypothetical protein